MEINCPSGLKGRIRKLKGNEADILSDRKAAAKGLTYDRILAAIWEETVDPGPYAIEGVPPWSKILVADRFCVLVAARIATYGPEYVFPVRCGETGKGCDHRFEWEINLETQLPLYDLPDESREKIKAGDNRFETTVAGPLIVFKLQTGADEREASKNAVENRSKIMTTALASRTVEIEGVAKGKIREYFADMDLDLQLKLLSAFEVVDGGFETQIEIECPKCMNVMGVSLPFEGEAFWLPRARRSVNTEGQKTRQGRTPRTLATSHE